MRVQRQSTSTILQGNRLVLQRVIRKHFFVYFRSHSRSEMAIAVHRPNAACHDPGPIFNRSEVQRSQARFVESDFFLISKPTRYEMRLLATSEYAFTQTE
jgi:hypothetical protein